MRSGLWVSLRLYALATVLSISLLLPSVGRGEQQAAIEGMGDLKLCMSRSAFSQGAGKSFEKKYGVLQQEENWNLGSRYFQAKTVVSFFKDKLAQIRWEIDETLDPFLSNSVYDALKAQLLKEYSRRQFYIQEDSNAIPPKLLVGDSRGNSVVLEGLLRISVTYTARGYRYGERAYWLKQQPQFCT